MVGNATPAWHRLRSQFIPRPAGARLRPAGMTTGRSSSGARRAILAAFEELYRAHSGRLFSLTCRMLGNPADAEDLLQDIFLVGAPEARYVSRRLRARHVAVSAGDEPVPRLPAEPRRRAASQVTDSLDDEPWIADASSRRLAERTVSKMDLERALAQLPDGCRAAFVLHDVEGLEHQEVAEVLGHRRGHVEVAGAQGAPAAAGVAGVRKPIDSRTHAWPATIRDAIQELVDGTLGPIRRAELQIHLDQCDECRALLQDLERIRDLAGSLDRPCRADRVWLQIAGRLRQEGRLRQPAPVGDAVARHVRRCRDRRSAAAGRRRIALPSPARSSAARASSWHAQPAPGDRPGSADGQAATSKETSRASSGLPSSTTRTAIAKLEEAAKSDQNAIDPQTAAMLQKNLQVIDQAIAESRAALRSEPTSMRGARQPVRRAEAEGRAAAGHDRADERDAQRQRRRGRADRRRRQQGLRHTGDSMDATTRSRHVISSVPIRRCSAAVPRHRRRAGLSGAHPVGRPAREREHRRPPACRIAISSGATNRPNARRGRSASAPTASSISRTSPATSTVTRGTGQDATIEIVKTARGADRRRRPELLGPGAGRRHRARGRAEVRTRYPSGDEMRSAEPPQRQRLGRPTPSPRRPARASRHARSPGNVSARDSRRAHARIGQRQRQHRQRRPRRVGEVDLRQRRDHRHARSTARSRRRASAAPSRVRKIKARRLDASRPSAATCRSRTWTASGSSSRRSAATWSLTGTLSAGGRYDLELALRQRAHHRQRRHRLRARRQLVQRLDPLRSAADWHRRGGPIAAAGSAPSAASTATAAPSSTHHLLRQHRHSKAVDTVIA